MWFKTRRTISLVFLGAAAALTSMPGMAAWPDQPIKIVIGSAPAGGVDIMARMVGNALATRLQAVVTVDNRPGAGGIIGADAVAKSKPDGYTLLIVNSGLMVQPVVHARLPYDTMKDLVGVTGIARGQAVLVASPTLNVKSGKEFLDLMRASPGKYNWPSLEAYTEVTTVMFNKRQGIDAVKVPYRAAAQMMPDISAGVTHYALGSIPAARPYIESGKLLAIAVASPKRNEDLPSVPTFREAGLADMEIWNRYGLFVPRGTPRPIQERLQQAIADMLRDPEILKSLKRQTLEPWETTIEQFQQDMADEFVLFKRIGAEAGIKPE
jgi:tripartite-type tricarboxylate transporter receptor subunit TctC